MGEVKRYELMWDDYGDPGVLEKSDGGLVIHSDHARIVTRLQRARARNLVARLKLLFGARSRSVVKTKRHDGKFHVGLTKPRFTLWTLDVADRIEAKYLRGEK